MSDPAAPPHEPSGWSRTRGIVAAVLAIAIVVLALVLSRADLASELAVVRSDLAAAEEELEENERDLDAADKEASRLQGALDTCARLAEMSRDVADVVRDLTTQLSRGGSRVPPALVELLELSSAWTSAIDACESAAKPPEE